MSRLIFINRYFFPDHSATSQVLSDLAFHLADLGRDVHIVTSRQIYDSPKALLPSQEVIKGVNVHRVASTRFGRGALAGRAVDYLSFYRSTFYRLAAMVRPGDIVIAKTDPPLTAVIALAATRGSGALLVNWLQDIYPETAIELGVPLMRGPFSAVLAALRDRALQRAAATVAVGELMGRKATALGATMVRVIPNWCDDETIKPVAASENPLRRDWNLANKFVFGYSGNLGRAHEFETVLNAAEELRGDPRFVFLMIGGGSRLSELKTIATKRRLEASFRFMPYQDRTALAYSLGVADAHWLSLNPKLEGLIVPSKFYGIAAAARPIVAIADRDGEIGRLVQRFGCGFVIAPGDTAALVAALQAMARDPAMVAELGGRARNMLDTQFTRRQGFTRWRELLDQLEQPR